MNEKAVFFFASAGKKKTALKSNEWMACELFRGQKKKTGKHPKISKNQLDFFFATLSEKKNTTIGFEWMNDHRTYPAKKKNTVPLVDRGKKITDIFWKCTKIVLRPIKLKKMFVKKKVNKKTRLLCGKKKNITNIFWKITWIELRS